MRLRFACLASLLLTAPLAIMLGKFAHPSYVSANETWSGSAAAHHLDARQTWWMEWPSARRDHETACVSCHTTLPYALARPTLRKTLGEPSPSITEEEMLMYIRKRVDGWSRMEPFYNDVKSGPNKTIESRGTESVLNALILARYDLPQHTMSDLTRKAFAAMWSKQLQTGEQAGAWDWLNFHNAPWESDMSQYYGATLAAIALGETPTNYKNSPQVQPHLRSLQTYLTSHYDAQPLVNKIVILWASRTIPGLLTVDQRQSLIDEVLSHQESDGGWSLSKLGDWKRHDNTAVDPRSDGYATGLTVYVLNQSGVSPQTPQIKHAVAWLVENQSVKEGSWPAYSLNKQRDLATDRGQFMSDAATSYAVMALESVQH